MQFNCPACGRLLAVKDEFAGRRTRCPGCQHVMVAPQAAPRSVPAAAQVGQPAPLPQPRPRQQAPVSTASRLQPAPARPVAPRPQQPQDPYQTPCTQCGESMPPGSVICIHCGFDTRSGEFVQKLAAGSSASGLGGADARCYIECSGTGTGVGRGIADRIDEFLDDEGVEFDFARPQFHTRPQLQPADLHVHCEVTQFDYGSRMMRYFLFPIPLFGPGSCQLAVSVNIQDGQGENQSFRASARQAVGLFGGSDEGMMNVNIKSVSNRIATRVTRHVAGRRFINRSVYQLALAALILGIASFVPCFPFGLIGLGVGIPALMAINSRGLPRRKAMAICGIVLSILGTIARNAVTLWLIKS